MGPDVIVVGGGVIGSSIAYHLAKARVRVLVFERGPGGGQASIASAGLLAPLSEASEPGAFVDLARESLRMFAPLAEELRERTGMDIGYRGSGLLSVALSESEALELRRRRAWLDRAGIVVSWLDPARIAELEPVLAEDVRGGLFYPREHQVSAPALTQALLRAAVDLGAIVRPGQVDRLLTRADRVVGVLVGEKEARAEAVVLANGAWVSAWSRTLQVPLPVRPVRGQMIALQTGGTSLRHIVRGHDGYLTTKADGRIYVGATVEEVGFDARPTAAGVAGLLSFAARLAPGLNDATFSSAWAGLRPATPDHLPLLGSIPGWQGVTIAAGHFRNGVLLAPITGELIADLVRHGRPRIPLDAFNPARFLIRAA